MLGFINLNNLENIIVIMGSRTKQKANVPSPKVLLNFPFHNVVQSFALKYYTIK